MTGTATILSRDLKRPLCTREQAPVDTSLWCTNRTRGTLKQRGGLQKNNTDAGPKRLQTNAAQQGEYKNTKT